MRELELGDKLKKLRQENGYSQNNLADKLHVTAQAISKWENNKSIPDITNLVQLSDVYNISLDSLIKPDKQLQKKLSIKNSRLKTFKWLILAAIFVFSVLFMLLIKAGFFMSQHGIGTWLLVGFGLLFIISGFLSMYRYIAQKNHFIFSWIAILMLSSIVFIGLFYSYILELI